MAEVKKRRVLSSDYDKMAEHIKTEIERRKGLPFRKDHEVLWAEVDRQVRMKAMDRMSSDPDDDWRSAMELGDLSTASEVLSADVLRLIFPQDRSWMLAHVNLEQDRLNARYGIQTGQNIPDKKLAEIQKKADGELRAFMTQQHTDFGLRARLELSVKEALHHGSFVAEVEWEEVQSYSVGGVFKSAASPVWKPHSMWNAYPDDITLNTNLFYTGSMILEWEEPYDWVLRQKNFINLVSFKKASNDKENKVTLHTYYGDITVKRKTDDVFLPNMKIIEANGVILYAQPNDTTQIIFGGYDRIDVRDPYFMSPLVKQSPNHKISSIIANRFIDNVELKLDPPIAYDSSDPSLVAAGGFKPIPGRQYPSKGGTQKFQQLDVGDPSWATTAIQYFKSEVQEGTGVSTPRAGGARQADRVTATQIEQEAHGSEVRTIDFVGKIEKGLRAYLYIQHELNKKHLKKYSFYNPEMGMKDFETIKKTDLPDEVHFEVVGSKGVLTERRRAQATSETTAFLLSNERTAHIPNVEEIAKQMYQDAGNKNPERLLNVANEDDKVQQAIQQIQEQAQATIAKMQEETQKVSQKLVTSEMELKNSQDQLKLRNERALGTEMDLRDEIKRLKDGYKQQMQMIDAVDEIRKEQQKLKDLMTELNLKKSESNQPKDITPSTPPVVVSIEKTSGYKINRNENGDMETVVPMNEEKEEVQS